MLSSGMMVSKHYCMGQLKSVAINAEAHDCAEGLEDVEMPCCDDSQSFHKLAQYHATDFHFLIIPAYAPIYELVAVTMMVAGQEFQFSASNTDDSPPPIGDILIFTQSLLI